MAESKEIGTFGEAVAADFLARKGIKVIKRNFYCRVGEIDLIATDGESTIFIEVKTRKTDSFGRAAEYVTYSKQQKVIKTALYYMGESSSPMRFDVVEVYYSGDNDSKRVTSINHIENAFS